MSDMSIISAILVVAVAFLAGLESILDQFQFHQPLVACTLIGAATGNLTAGIMLGGSLQMITLAWANIGAAVAPDVALASVAAAIILVKGGKFTAEGIGVAIAIAILLAVAGLFLTMPVRTASIAFVHAADKAAEHGNIAGVERAYYLALLLQGLRIAVPAALLLAIPAQSVQHALGLMPDWLTHGLVVGTGVDQAPLAGVAASAVEIGVAGDNHAGLQPQAVVVDLHNLGGKLMAGDPGVGDVGVAAPVGPQVAAADAAIEQLEQGLALPADGLLHVLDDNFARFLDANGFHCTTPRSFLYPIIHQNLDTSCCTMMIADFV